jgi:hypothetical protein
MKTKIVKKNTPPAPLKGRNGDYKFEINVLKEKFKVFLDVESVLKIPYRKNATKT